MRFTVGTVTGIGRAALVGTTALAAWALFGPGVPAWRGLGWIVVTHAALAYGLTILSFVSFPHARRSDLAGVMVLMSAAAEVIHRVAGGGPDALSFTADLAGVFAVLAPSHLERVRSAARRPAASRFTLGDTRERRMRRRRTQAGLAGTTAVVRDRANAN